MLDDSKCNLKTKQNKKQGNEHAQLNIQYSPILMNIYNIGFSSFTITEGTFSPHMDTQTRPHRWSNLCMLHEYRQLHHNSEDFMVFKQRFNHNWSLMLCQSMPAFILCLSNTYDLSLACIMIKCVREKILKAWHHAVENFSNCVSQSEWEYLEEEVRHSQLSS